MHGEIVSWIAAFLGRRSFRVSVNGCRLEVTTVEKGVPQGSVLRPLLHLLYVNGLSDILPGKILFFADDVKLVSPSSSLNILLSDLPITHEWFTRCDLPLNASTCGPLCVGNDLPDPLPLYPGGPAFPNITSTKNLGVVVDASYKPSGNCAAAAKRARAALFLIRRSFTPLAPNIFALTFSMPSKLLHST